MVASFSIPKNNIFSKGFDKDKLTFLIKWNMFDAQ